MDQRAGRGHAPSLASVRGISSRVCVRPCAQSGALVLVAGFRDIARKQDHACTQPEYLSVNAQQVSHAFVPDDSARNSCSMKA